MCPSSSPPSHGQFVTFVKFLATSQRFADQTGIAASNQVGHRPAAPGPAARIDDCKDQTRSCQTTGDRTARNINALSGQPAHLPAPAVWRRARRPDPPRASAGDPAPSTFDFKPDAAPRPCQRDVLHSGAHRVKPACALCQQPSAASPPAHMTQCNHGRKRQRINYREAMQAGTDLALRTLNAPPAPRNARLVDGRPFGFATPARTAPAHITGGTMHTTLQS